MLPQIKMDPIIIQKLKNKLLSGEYITDEYLYRMDDEICYLKLPTFNVKKPKIKKISFIKKILSFHKIFKRSCIKYNSCPLSDYH